MLLVDPSLSDAYENTSPFFFTFKVSRKKKTGGTPKMKKISETAMIGWIPTSFIALRMNGVKNLPNMDMVVLIPIAVDWTSGEYASVLIICERE